MNVLMLEASLRSSRTQCTPEAWTRKSDLCRGRCAAFGL